MAPLRFRSLLPLALLAAAALGACRSEPYCLNCVDGAPVADVPVAEVEPIDVPTVDVPEVDAEDTGPEATPDGCTPGAPEVCNGVDDNCDGRVDEGIDLQTDERNCGMCGRVCAPPHAIPVCQMGRCAIAPMGCDTNFHDLDGNPDNGCEYACTPVPGATNDATCDGRDDDCDGRRDEDVDLCGDARNCGMCGRTCALPHATAQCTRTGAGDCSTANTRCAVGRCETGFYDLDGVPDNGCEYECTPSGAETCNGRDDDCDGMVDEGDPGGGTACGMTRGACRAGVNHCRMGTVVCEGAVGPSPELCNGVDDDCNGMVDDGTLSADTRIGVPCGSGVGDCRPGQQRCVSGAPACVGAVGPTTEVCDGRDNNCDGMIDNGVAPGGACGSSVGACRPGTLTCVGGTMVCTGATRGSVETCNGIDDDCDGTVDNGFDLQRDANNCGRCGNACAALPNAVTACQAGMCVMLACAPGFFDLNRNPADGCEYACSFSSSTEICNGLDDNCNGMIDEGVTPPAGFCRTAGLCAGATARCSGSRGFTCTYPAGVELDPMTGQPVAVETRCDGLDNNCNGAIDESFPTLNQPCTNGGVGSCGASGRMVCNAGGTGTTCNAPPVGSPSPEVCDGIDNDCDGSIDETRVAPGTNPSFVTTSWVQVQTGLWVMQYEASRPDATTSTQGVLGNRACSKPGVLPWTNLTASQAAAACAAAGARLCTETEWQTACRSSTGACTWSYASACTTYSSSTCNGVDNDIDPGTPGTQNGLVATGAEVACYASFTGGRVFDMSGNVKEFTAPRAAGVNPLRGGSYNNLATGTTCTFDWTVVDDNFRFVNAGFRCCFTGTTPP
jgi:hypothetical protein